MRTTFKQTLHAVALLGALAFATTVVRAADPLPSWNDTAPKQAIMQWLKETAVAVDREMLPAFLQWRAAGNGWYSPVNNAEWGTDYLNRTVTGKSNIYDNHPEDTKYICTGNDKQGKQLNGRNSYAITFPKGQLPPVKGFWLLTLYNSMTSRR